MLSKIKEEFKTKRVAFGKSAAPLGSRTDLDDLAIIAHESQSKSLLNLFEKLPALSLLKKTKTDSELKKIVPAVESKPSVKTVTEKKDPNASNKKTIKVDQNLNEDPNEENKKGKN